MSYEHISLDIDNNNLVKRVNLSTQDMYNLRIGNTVVCRKRSFTEDKFINKVGEIIKLDSTQNNVTILMDGTSKIRSPINSVYGIILNEGHLEFFGFDKHDGIFVNDKPLRAPIIAEKNTIDEEEGSFRGYNILITNTRKDMNDVVIANVQYLHQLENLMHFSLYQKRH